MLYLIVFAEIVYIYIYIYYTVLIGFAKPAMLPGTRQIPVGQEVIIFSAPQGPDPKILQRALNPQLFPE